MNTARLVILWAILLSAGLVLAGVAGALLNRERARVQLLTEEAVETQAVAIADNATLLMNEIRASMEEGLRALELMEGVTPTTTQLPPSLRSWIAERPLFSTGFYRSSRRNGEWALQEGGEVDIAAALAELFPSAAGIEKPMSERANLTDTDGTATAPSPGAGRGKSEKTEPTPPPPSPSPQEAAAAADTAGGAREEAPVGAKREISQNLARFANFKETRQNIQMGSVTSTTRARRTGENKGPAKSASPLNASPAPTRGAPPKYQTLADELAPMANQAPGNAPEQQAAAPEPAFHFKKAGESWAGWLAWESQPAKSSGIAGAVLSPVEVSRALEAALPGLSEVPFTLRDPRGRAAGSVGFETASIPLLSSGSSQAEPSLRVNLEGALEGWSVDAFLPSSEAASSLVWVGGSAVAASALSIAVAATLLFWQAQRDAREARQKTTFLAQASHELRTPLTNLKLYAELIGQRTPPEEQQRLRYAEVLHSESERLGRLVDALLQSSRLERGAVGLQAQSVDLALVASEALEAERAALEAAGFAIDTLGLGEPAVVHGDRDALKQIVVILLDNACKHAADGKWVRVALSREKTKTSLLVADRGLGVPQDLGKRVFRPFARGDRMLTETGGGMGLGLAIARGLAEQMGGSLELLDSSRGAIFRLSLPQGGKGLDSQSPAGTAQTVNRE